MAVPKASCIVYETPSCDCPCQEKKGVCVCGHTCGQKPPKPHPCKIYLPPKPNPGILDDLRHLNILKLIGDLLTFLLLLLFLLTLLELLIFHFITSHGSIRMPEDTAPKVAPRISPKPDLPPKILPKIPPQTEDPHDVPPRPPKQQPDPHYVPETDGGTPGSNDNNADNVPESEHKPNVEEHEPNLENDQNSDAGRENPHPDAGRENPHSVMCQPPCLNGGMCIVNPSNPNGKKLCLCPEGTQGNQCQEIVEVPKEKEETEESPNLIVGIFSGDVFHKKNLKIPSFDKPKANTEDKPETKWTLGIPKIAAQSEATPSGQDITQMKFPERETRQTGMKFPEADLPKKEKAACEREPYVPYFYNLFWG